MLFAVAAGFRDSDKGIAALGRLAVAIVETAVAIGAEASGTANYANRQKWVNQVFSSADAPFAMARTMFLAVVTTAPVVTELDAGMVPSDADLAAAVSALVNTFAGRI
jgi:hypothetical protein